MITTPEIIGFFVVLTIIVGLSIWYASSIDNKSNFEIIHSYKDYFKSFKEDYLNETKLNKDFKQGSIVLCNDKNEILNNFQKLDDPNLYKCFTTEIIKKSHPKLERLPKSYPSIKVFNKLLYNSMRNKCVIINFFTKGLIDEWRNLLYTLRAVNLADLLLVFPLDSESLEAVKSENIKYDSSLINDNIQAISKFGDGGWKNITCNKVLAISKILKKGNFVFYLDTDIVVKKDFIEDYFTLPPMDIYMQSDRANFEKLGVLNGVKNYSTGVMFIAPTKYMINIMDTAYPKILNVKSGGLTDQKIINELLNINKIGCLCTYKYPNGWRYFTSNISTKDPVLIHNNWIVGVDKKINRFKEFNLWYV